MQSEKLRTEEQSRRCGFGHAFGVTMAAAALAGILAVSTACERRGPAERAGESIDEAVEDIGDAIEDAGRGR